MRDTGAVLRLGYPEVLKWSTAPDSTGHLREGRNKRHLVDCKGMGELCSAGDSVEQGGDRDLGLQGLRVAFACQSLGLRRPDL